jgi:hypothetical protein
VRGTRNLIDFGGSLSIQETKRGGLGRGLGLLRRVRPSTLSALETRSLLWINSQCICRDSLALSVLLGRIVRPRICPFWRNAIPILRRTASRLLYILLLEPVIRIYKHRERILTFLYQLIKHAKTMRHLAYTLPRRTVSL